MGILWYTLGLALTPPFLSLLHDGRRICGDWRLAQPATGFCRGPRARDRPDGKVLVARGISVSRPQLTKTLSSLGAEPITHLINTHWHFDHTSGNEWLHSVGAKIIAHSNTRKHLSEIQRVEDWDYNFLPLPSGAIPTEVLSANRNLKLNGASIELKPYQPAHTE